MAALREFRNLDIDWDMSPEDAVTRHLEWGNNNWQGKHRPVTTLGEHSYFFRVNTWEDPPVVDLVRMDGYGSRELAQLPLPEGLAQGLYRERGRIRGVMEPTREIKQWLAAQMNN